MTVIEELALELESFVPAGKSDCIAILTEEIFSIIDEKTENGDRITVDRWLSYCHKGIIGYFIEQFPWAKFTSLAQAQAAFLT
jgi:hypothetical protein